MNDAHYVVTGGAGFIGSHLVDALIVLNHRVVVLDDFSTGKRENLRAVAKSSKLQVIDGDIRNMDVVMDVSRNAKGIFHLAALVSVQRSIENPQLSFDINVRGAINVLEASRMHNVPRMVFASSAALYGDAGAPVSEQMGGMKMLSPYALDKLVIEQYGALYGELYGISTTALRYFNVYGSRQDSNSPYSGVISIFAEKIRSGSEIGIYGDGEQTRDFIHVSDVVQANLAAMESNRMGAQVFNVGTGTATSINRLVEVLSTIADRRVAPGFLPARHGDIRYSMADISLIRERLGFEPKIGLTRGLRELVASLAGP
ncbi:MAG: NAD-dependent epimerase/dehydratase family protein [Gammaproteobacteria bacterium]